jgi:hypothetical protein
MLTVIAISQTVFGRSRASRSHSCRRDSLQRRSNTLAAGSTVVGNSKLAVGNKSGLGRLVSAMGLLLPAESCLELGEEEPR